MSVRILSERELRDCAQLETRTINTIAGAFASLHRGEAVMPPVLSMDLAERNAEVDIKTAWLRGLDQFAIKVSSGFFDNPQLGLPSLSGMMVLLDAATGRVSATLLDNGWLTDLRTAAAGAVAANYLARPEAATALIVGTGVQARLQLEALIRVRPIQRALIWGRDPGKAQQCADDSVERLGVPTAVVDDLIDGAHEADIVATTTPAREPVLPAAALHPGLHITAIGADAADKNEVEPAALQQVDVLACDRRSQCELIGELRSALAAGAVTRAQSIIELGAIAADDHPGRSDNEQITFADLTGTGVQDTAIAALALELASEHGFGRAFDTA